MDKAQLVRNAAVERIGCPYVMGGTGKVCSPSYREARAAQYPNYAAQIRNNCPRLSGSASSCITCKWADPETGNGKLCFDCAQLALACMAAAGIPLVSGANSQWKKTRFSESGEISGLPRDKVCLVFRKDSDGKMHHVGVYMGDGSVIHARGHAYGVVQERLDEISKPFTHYGVPSGLYDNVYPTVRRGNSGPYVAILQQALQAAGISIETDGKFGKNTEQAVKTFQGQYGLTADGICGKNTWAALAPYLPDQEPAPVAPDPEPAPPSPPEIDDDDDDGGPYGYAVMTYQEAAEIKRSLSLALNIIEKAMEGVKP